MEMNGLGAWQDVIWNDVIPNASKAGLDIARARYGGPQPGQYMAGSYNPATGQYTYNNYAIPDRSITGGFTNMPPISLDGMGSMVLWVGVGLIAFMMLTRR